VLGPFGLALFEAEALKLKSLGVTTFHAIAQQITKIGAAKLKPAVEFPPE